jgi:hypothetical protein
MRLRVLVFLNMKKLFEIGETSGAVVDFGRSKYNYCFKRTQGINYLIQIPSIVRAIG